MIGLMMSIREYGKVPNDISNALLQMLTSIPKEQESGSSASSALMEEEGDAEERGGVRGDSPPGTWLTPNPAPEC